ncbi:MAG: 2-C-methyl-D-erythritol 2,4-cyclodiphosphate synthase [candidate division WOR-3 bacterium]|nr:2-C-methyl-D-erythritol 2,4-cyclodiphosphate synthase [candidate division WOR-3 bacterium]MCX7756816.1 2-C-methyl-D-erythritol 2,4-cyclodiphosphate synthase [candidate division WOR-3 bacterium]MDW7988013.1 2-C-methyl-D-erythritol 2,4-cyclodiphosphate synthase [candidate division WOR-3 bacterium]
MRKNFFVGIGFDIHRLTLGRKLILGGIEIPFDKGLLGHSDGDVLCHAICDALLSSAGLSDIGSFFPDTDPKYKDISSVVILKEILARIKKKKLKIINLSAVLICETPKLNPYFKQIKTQLAKILKISENNIGLSAKTTEQMLFSFKKQAIACFAVVLVKR